jgi:peptidoglycan hydrolase-like protein with peptidoglycan-binding domain
MVTVTVTAVSSGGGGGGGSVAVASQYAPTVPQSVASSSQPLAVTSTLISAAGSSTADLEAELDSLLAVLNSLLAQAKARGIAVAPTTGTESLFTENLSFGMSGSEVTKLQEFLAEDSSIYPQGKVTGYFGALTTQAVQRFQTKYGIASYGAPGYGTAGPKTRAKLNSLIESGLAP